MLLFMLRPMILFFRVFREKIDEVIAVTPVPEYLVHIGMAPQRYRISYRGRYLMVTIWSVLPGWFLAVLSGSLILEYIFNFACLGMDYYGSLAYYGVASWDYLIHGFCFVHRIGDLVCLLR